MFWYDTFYQIANNLGHMSDSIRYSSLTGMQRILSMKHLHDDMFDTTVLGARDIQCLTLYWKLIYFQNFYKMLTEFPWFIYLFHTHENKL